MIWFSFLLFIHLNSIKWAESQRLYQQTSHLTQIRIGGLFVRTDTKKELVLKQAVSHLNRDRILPNYELSVVSESMSSHSSFHTREHVCNLLREGVVSLFGPQNPDIGSHMQAICDRYDIPHIETSWDYRTRQDKYAINLFPHPDILGEAFTNLIDETGWDTFAILYDSRENLFNLQGLIRASVPMKRTVIIRKLSAENEFRPLLKSLQREINIKKIIVDCEVNKALEVLKQAQEIGMIRYDYEFILTTLDLQPWDLDQFRNGDAKIGAFRLVDAEKPEAMAVLAELESVDRSYRQQLANTGHLIAYEKRRGISTAEALVYDAVKLLGLALRQNVVGFTDGNSIICGQDASWKVGSSIINSMRSMPAFHGLTGIVQFNNSGYRTDINLDVIELTQQGLQKIGVWEYARHFKNRFTWLNTHEELSVEETDKMPLWNRTLTVVTILTTPFCMHALSEEALTGNSRFVGFNVDLIEQLHLRMKFEYKIQLVEDGTHDGMIADVLNKKGDLVIGDLTVTKERQTLMDFTMPFMNLGISILFSQPQAKPPSLFSFMSPFALEVWIYMLIAFFGISFVLFTVGRLTPYEWDNPLPCVTEPEELHNQFSFANSFWFTIGSIMQQGSDLAPKAVSTRIIAGTWWFFTLIMVSSYTANLATFLIVQELEDSFSGLKELSTQSKIEYGCVENGSTMKFFKFSSNEVKKKIWENMEAKAEWVLTTSNDEGVNKVRARPGKYAFFMESTLIEYYMERKCGLTQVGGLLDHKGYGIALPKNSPYLDKFNAEILKMQENGDLDRLKRKWWKEEGKETAETCPTASVSDSVKALKLANVGGVFVVLVCGCLVSALITLIEFCRKFKNDKLEGESWKHEIIKDLYFALQCRGNVKPVKKEKTNN